MSATSASIDHLHVDALLGGDVGDRRVPIEGLPETSSSVMPSAWAATDRYEEPTAVAANIGLRSEAVPLGGASWCRCPRPHGVGGPRVRRSMSLPRDRSDHWIGRRLYVRALSASSHASTAGQPGTGRARRRLDARTGDPRLAMACPFTGSARTGCTSLCAHQPGASRADGPRHGSAAAVPGGRRSATAVAGSVVGGVDEAVADAGFGDQAGVARGRRPASCGAGWRTRGGSASRCGTRAPTPPRGSSGA